MKIGFIGLGLIGGSLAKTIKRIYPEAEIMASDPDRDNLTLAVNEGIVEKTVTTEYLTGSESLKELDYLFLCAPVITNIDLLGIIKDNIGDSKVIISDVGSVKSEITEKAVSYGLSGFVGGHPMAGSEKTGFAHANDHLFENVYYILTNDAASGDALISFTDFILSINAIPVTMEASYHDFVMSGISHTPHFVAAGLVHTVKDSSKGAEVFKKLAAGGFKDITRVASSSPEMWAQIAMSNSDNIIKELDICIKNLKDIRASIKAHDRSAVYSFMKDAGEYRSSISESGILGFNTYYRIHCDLADEAGSIARVATILADNEISIKNIGIVHNREYNDGALLIEFYDEVAMNSAVKLLENRDYTVYRR
ncbi:MAG: prephenate dehydrogenase/arogenate dehydrogenase family protein [Lachnospiraceae bacterium]|nr:prephenate dehydrogenase/arogenate dehydrogenase family protein [Lachnospiraceae bacterium]